jgi:hypothetical protein
MQKVTIKLTKAQVAYLMDMIENASLRFPSHTYMFIFSEVISKVYSRLNNKHWAMSGNTSYNLKVNRGEAAALWELCKSANNQAAQQRILIINIMAKIDKLWSFAALESKQKSNPHE